MAVRYLADANLHHGIVSGCLRREFALDFLSANGAGLEGMTDAQVLAIAAGQTRILVTHDFQTMPSHFADFLESHGSSPGIFLAKQRTPIAEVIDALVLIWSASEPGDWENRIVAIPL
jgi:hypothetical protein